MNQQLMADYPDEKDEQVLAVLRREGRANPKLIREETGLDKGTVNTVLVRASRHGDVTQVERGLYDYTGEDAEVQIPASVVRAGLGDLVDALERGDWGAVRAAIERLREEAETDD